MNSEDALLMTNPGTAVVAGAQAKTGITDTIWFNALWFQSLWFCTVLGRDTALPIALALIALHLILVQNLRRELLQITTIGFMGISVDAALSAAGLFIFPGGTLVPLWLCCLWLGFATTLTRSLAWLGSKPLLASAAAAIALPLNYWAGQRLGAVQFGFSLPVTLGTMAAIWAILFPILYTIARTLDAADLRENQS